MSKELLELGASTLGELVEDVVFVGGATITLWISDPAAPPPRPTDDVDVIVEVATRREYHKFERILRGLDFRDDGRVICRWRHKHTGLVLDAMPTDAELLGFENQWQRRAFAHAVTEELPSGACIKAVPPPFLLATKVEAYLARGKGDLLGSRDFADIVALVDGREEFASEMAAAPNDVRGYRQEKLTPLLPLERFLDGIHAQLLPDAASQDRAEDVVLSRFKQIAGGR